MCLQKPLCFQEGVTETARNPATEPWVTARLPPARRPALRLGLMRGEDARRWGLEEEGAVEAFTARLGLGGALQSSGLSSSSRRPGRCPRRDRASFRL